MSDRSRRDIVASFNKNINGIINCAAAKIKNNNVDLANLDRVKKRIHLLKQITDEEALISRSGKYLLNYRDKIVSLDTDFIFTVNPADECKKLGIVMENDDAYMVELLNNIRNYYAAMSDNEKKAIARMVYGLYKDYVAYVAVA